MMNRFRTSIGVLLAITCAAIALPVTAASPSKTFNFSMTVPTPNAVGPQNLIAYITNLSNPNNQNGTSNIASGQISVDPTFSGGLRITGVASVERLISVSPDVSSPDPISEDQPIVFTSTSIVITGISTPVKGGETLKVTINVDGSGAQTPWTARVFTSSNMTGGEFTSASQQPVRTDVASGSGVVCGGPTVFVSRTDASGFVTVPVTRGPYNSDGSCAVGESPTRIFVNNLLNPTATPPTNTVQVAWPVLNEFDAQPEAAFEFDADITAPAANLKIAFKNYAGTSTPAFLNVASTPALSCSLASSALDWFPRPYGYLVSDITKNTTKFTVTPTGPNPTVDWPTTFPTNLIIDDELMIVTKIQVNNGTWTVTRLPGAVGHSATAPVMYTPLNRFATAPTCVNIPTGGSCPYVANELAKSCLINGPTGDNGAYRVIGIGDPIFSGGGGI